MTEDRDLEQGGRCLVAAVLFITLIDLLASAACFATFASPLFAAGAGSIVCITVVLADWLDSGSSPARAPFFVWLAAQIVLNVVATGLLTSGAFTTHSLPQVGLLLTILGVRFLIYGISLVVLARSDELRGFLAERQQRRAPGLTSGTLVIAGIALALPALAVLFA